MNDAKIGGSVGLDGIQITGILILFTGSVGTSSRKVTTFREKVLDFFPENSRLLRTKYPYFMERKSA